MADMKPQGTQAYGIESGYEHGDANIGSVVAGLGIIVGSTLVVMAAMFGMFNYMNKQMDKRDAAVPPALTAQIIPAHPRLLPSPYTDHLKEVETAKKASGAVGNRVGADDTVDGLPWDKRTVEIIKQDQEANTSGTNATGNHIPVAAAMELEAGIAPGKGTPSVMPWQEDYASRVAGTTEEGLNLDEGQKKVEPNIFDNRPHWESPDEQFSADSSGGLTLKANKGGTGWSR